MFTENNRQKKFSRIYSILKFLNLNKYKKKKCLWKMFDKIFFMENLISFNYKITFLEIFFMGSRNFFFFFLIYFLYPLDHCSRIFFLFYFLPFIAGCFVRLRFHLRRFTIITFYIFSGKTPAFFLLLFYFLLLFLLLFVLVVCLFIFRLFIFYYFTFD